MNKLLAGKYAECDNILNRYFDQVLLDFLTEDFRKEYHQLQQDILEEIFKDNQYMLSSDSDSPVYIKHPDYDDMTILLLEHYDTVKKCDKIQAVYETEIMLVEHYLALCGIYKDELGYWLDSIN